MVNLHLFIVYHKLFHLVCEKLQFKRERRAKSITTSRRWRRERSSEWHAADTCSTRWVRAPGWKFIQSHKSGFWAVSNTYCWPADPRWEPRTRRRRRRMRRTPGGAGSAGGACAAGWAGRRLAPSDPAAGHTDTPSQTHELPTNRWRRSAPITPLRTINIISDNHVGLLIRPFH